MSRGRWRYFPPSRPIEVSGGIKSQARRGQKTSWWSEKWLELLESFQLGARLQRGRRYARKGQVTSLEIGKGCVKSLVQGSVRKPYEVEISLAQLSPGKWLKIAAALGTKPVFVARLLIGELPEEILELLVPLGLSLFPKRHSDLVTRCSCPDSSNPCKHIAAVYYLLGEEFDRDPFLIFTLRGMERQDFIDFLASSSVTEKTSSDKLDLVSKNENDLLSTDPNSFWHGGAMPADVYGSLTVPERHATLPKRLGSFPFWRGEQPFLEALEWIYKDASEHGMDAFMGQLNAE